MTIAGMKRRFERIDTDVLVRESLQENQETLRDINLRQMYDGKTRTGADIRPSYFEDPYFKSYQEAAAYSDWKDKITPSGKRSPGTPNLYINGYYYRSRFVAVDGDNVIHGSTWVEGAEIEQKFKNIDGLGGEYKQAFLKNYVLPVLSDKIFQETGLKMVK